MTDKLVKKVANQIRLSHDPVRCFVISTQDTAKNIIPIIAEEIKRELESRGSVMEFINMHEEEWWRTFWERYKGGG